MGPAKISDVLMRAHLVGAEAAIDEQSAIIPGPQHKTAAATCVQGHDTK
jgi:hypothetical protein